jgi:hypothetical protein
LSAEGLGVRVQTEEDAFVDERVLLLRPWALLDPGTCRADSRLNLSAVDEASDVRVGDLGSGKAIHNSQSSNK